MALQVVVASGLRVSELTALRVSDLERDSQRLWVACGKGGDGRLVLMASTR